MASRRNLKKHVGYIADSVAGLCIMESMDADGQKKEQYAQIVLDIIHTRLEIISRISHTEPGNVRGFYKKLVSDFNAKIEEFFNRLEELGRK